MNQETQGPKKTSKLYRNTPFIGSWLAQKFKGMKNTVSFWVKAPRKTTKMGEVRGQIKMIRYNHRTGINLGIAQNTPC